MSVLKVLVFILFLASGSWSEEEALEPSCTGVEDFGACLGNTNNFCPTGIPCQCKNEKPFCRCDYFRVGWKEYWYMGPKCNRLWNTLDLILVSTLPAVALVATVVLIFCCVSHCKSKKAGKQTNSAYHEAQHNPAFAAERDSEMSKGTWVGQIPKAVFRRQDFDDAPSPSQLENSSPVYPQPLRRPDPATARFSNQQPQYEKSGYSSSNLPSAGYAEGRQHWKY